MVHFVRIDPDNIFRLVVKVAKYVADREYGLVEMAGQEHNLWLDRTWQYTLDRFHDEMATQIFWGHHKHYPSGYLTVTVVLNGNSEGINIFIR